MWLLREIVNALCCRDFLGSRRAGLRFSHSFRCRANASCGHFLTVLLSGIGVPACFTLRYKSAVRSPFKSLVDEFKSASEGIGIHLNQMVVPDPSEAAKKTFARPRIRKRNGTVM